MIEKIISRLQLLNYEVKDNDIFALKFVLQKVESHVKNFCNINEIPVGLENVVIDSVCGEFLLQKKAAGQLTGAQIDGVVKKIKDGDTEVEFATGGDTGTAFDSYMNNLTSGHEECLLKYRRLCW